MTLILSVRSPLLISLRTADITGKPEISLKLQYRFVNTLLQYVFWFFSSFISCTVFSTASFAAPQIPLSRWMLDLNPGPFQHLQWQPDALTTWLDPIHRG